MKRKLSDLTRWDMERLEREAFTRDELRDELRSELAEREQDDPVPTLEDKVPF